MRFLPPGSIPYVAPYALFLVLVELQALLPATAPVVFPLRVIGTALLLAWYWRRGAYRELLDYRVGAGTLLDFAAGCAIAAIWVGPYLLWPSLPRGAAFDPELLGPDARALMLALRLAGFALVTPFVEELFVRSFLLRFAETYERGDYRAEPIARFGVRSFVVTVLWFTFTHAPWEWWVAFPAGIAFNLWLYARGHLTACVVAHAVANAAIWALVVFEIAPLWEFL